MLFCYKNRSEAMIVAAQGDFGEFLSVCGNAAYPAYIIKGKEKRLMIDAGVNLMGPAYLGSLRDILGDENDLDYLFVTHSHYDHLGALPYLKRHLPRLQTGACGRIEQLMRKKSVLQRMTALSEPHREQMRHLVGDEDVSLGPVAFELHLQQGDRFDLGGVTCEVHEVPGHTRDSLAFFVPEIRALFAGEAHGFPVATMPEGIQVEFLSSYDDYLRSLEKMIALGPGMIGMAHLWVYTDDDASGYLRRSLQATPLYRRRIEDFLHRAGGDVETACGLMARQEYDERGSVVQSREAYLENLRARVRLVSAMLNRN
jgi:glyoxylase-like metal-dependent hydrolase (beta-lactamase superfamily II)